MVNTATACVAVPNEFWTEFVNQFSLELVGLVVPVMLVVLTVFYGLILPAIERHAERRIHRLIEAGKFPTLSVGGSK